MRYLIYDSNIERVELQKEFDFNRSYIELMQHRISSKIKLEVNIDRHLPDIKIPPLLFIPFIENAFKHGVSYREDSFISILLNADKEKLVFESKNSIPTAKIATDQKGGVGIDNIQKRLKLIYGDSAKLKMEITNKEYLIQLTLPLAINIHA